MISRTGFTGTREGMTEAQQVSLRVVLKLLSGWWHHGDCFGGDAESHGIAKKMGLFVTVHPPINPKFRAFCSGDETRPTYDYIERNRNIVTETQRLVAAPDTTKEEWRSGTWATVRWARKLGKPIAIIRPNGQTVYEGEWV